MPHRPCLIRHQSTHWSQKPRSLSIADFRLLRTHVVLYSLTSSSFVSGHDPVSYTHLNIMPRDKNAAINILEEGLRTIKENMIRPSVEGYNKPSLITTIV